MRKISISNQGIHFETDAGMVNAHWSDIFGFGCYKLLSKNNGCKFTNKKVFTFYSLKRFWKSVLKGIIFVVKRKF